MSTSVTGAGAAPGRGEVRVWPARARVRALLAVDAAFSLGSFATFAAILLFAEDWDADVGPPSTVVAWIGFLVIVLAALAQRRVIRARRLAVRAARLPDHAAVRRATRGAERGEVCARLMCLYPALLAVRFLSPSALEPATLLTIAGVALCATLGPAVGSVLAVGRYERSRRRTLFVADAVEGPMFWRDSASP